MKTVIVLLAQTILPKRRILPDLFFFLQIFNWNYLYLQRGCTAILTSWHNRGNMLRQIEWIVGWLVKEVEQLFNVLKQWITAVPARALSRTNHINAAYLSNSLSWAFR